MMWDDLSQYIINLAMEKSKRTGRNTKIVEIGVGRFQSISNRLQENENIEVIMTDINPSNENVVKDDIFNPSMSLYENTDILFSIRPPAEIQKAIMDLRDELNCTLIIKPLFNEDLNIELKKMKLKNNIALKIEKYSKLRINYKTKTILFSNCEK